MITVKRLRKTRSQNAIEDSRGSGRGQRWWLSVRPGPTSSPSKRRAMGLRSSSFVCVATVMHAHPWEEEGHVMLVISMSMPDLSYWWSTCSKAWPLKRAGRRNISHRARRGIDQGSAPLGLCMEQTADVNGDSQIPKGTMRGGGWAAAVVRGFLGAGRRVRNCGLLRGL
jgi:hypothetical protein